MAMTEEQRVTLEALTVAHPEAMAKLRDTVMTVIDQAIEEGRREILREIAAMEPLADGPFAEFCVFCGPAKHKPDCLWLRAQAVLTAS